MKLIDKILLANDFTTSSKNVVATATELAKIFQSEVVPIHILPNDVVNQKVRSLLEDTAYQKLQETNELLEKEGVTTISPILAYGPPHHEIVDAAVNVNAGLILLGSGETRSSKEKFLLGTTTERIIQKSEKPILVVKEGVPLNVQHILCPVDFSEPSQRALKNAITLAHRFKAELTVLSICELQSSSWFGSEKDNDLENDSRCDSHKEQFDQFLEGFNFSGLKYNKEIRRGIPAEEILSAVSGKMIDLLIMGTSGKTGLSRFVVGSVTEKVIREVPCSFITLKSENIINLQLETSIRDIENHYHTGKQLMADGFYEESLEQFKLCLSINTMHVPSHYGIAKVYEKLNMPKKAEFYRHSAREIMDRIYYLKIEEEVRKLKGH